MPRALKPGDKIRSYTVEDQISTSIHAITYRAKDARGKAVFLKQFKSPTPSPACTWYREFVTHQEALQRRIHASDARNFAIVILDQFEAPQPPFHRTSGFFQIAEFFEHGENLAALLANSTGLRWEQRMVWAKVIMGSLDRFHRAGIVHTDLKPENLFMIEDRSIVAGHQLKIIDLDSAIFVGQSAPWVLGTDGYFSPEHGITIPTAKSDVFTSGLILYELLAGFHPYKPRDEASDKDEYRAAIKTHGARVPVLQGEMPGGNNREVAELLHAMLSPDQDRRPAARAVLNVLNAGTTPAAAVRVPAAATSPPPASPSPAPARDVAIPKSPALLAGKSPAVRTRMELRGPSGRSMRFHVSTPLGARLVRQVSDEHDGWDKDVQLRLEHKDGAWFAVPSLSVKNDTLLNGVRLAERTRLATNDVIAVGRASTGVVRSPLRVEITGHDGE